MNIELLNIFFYLIPLLIYWKNNKTIDIYLILVAAYTFTAVMCYLNIITGFKEFTQTTMIPYIYLAVCVFICLAPFRHLSFDGNFSVRETKLIKMLMWIYIVSGILAAYYTIPDTVLLYETGEWGELRNELYDDPTSVIQYHSQFERFCKNVFSYLTPFGIVMAFYQISKPKKNPLLIILLFTVWILNSFLSSTLVASRGMILNMVLTIGMLFVLFKNCISASVKRYAFIIACAVLFFFASYTIAVSVSRFGEEEAGDSIFLYLGHSMIAFNQGIMGTMHDYAWGKYFFNYFYSLFGWNPTIHSEAMGMTAGTRFVTFVGSFYKDLGPFLTIPFLILLSKYVSSLTKQSSPSLSTLILIVFFMSFYQNGIFVFGRGEGLRWVMVFVVYFIVKFSEKRSY